MRKKFFAIYALAGALVASPVFTSCVDDAESPSVTNIRNEKANQLKALAALQTAQAEAAKIQANADAAYKAAQGAYYEAMAAAEQADAAYQAEMLKQAQEKFAIELEQIKAQAEQQISYAKLQALRNMASIEDFENEELKSLYYDLQNAINELNNLNYSKLNTTNWYNQAKAGLEFTKADAEAQAKYYDKQIARQEFIIATYEKYEGADLEKIYQDMQIAKKDAQKLDEAVIPYQEAANKAWDAYYEKQDAYYEANNAYYETSNDFYYNNGNNQELAILDLTQKVLNNWNWYDGQTYRDMINEETKLLAGDYSINYYTLNADVVTWFKAYFTQRVDTKKDDIGTPAVAATETTAAVAATGMYRDIENYDNWIAQEKENIATWEEQLEADPTQTWLNNDINDAKNNITNYENWKAERLIYIDSQKLELAEIEAQLAEIVALEAAFTAESEEMVAYEAAIAAQKALAEAAITALEAAEELKEAAEKANEDRNKANDAAQEKWDEYNVLENKYNYSTDVESIITNAQNSINNYKRWKQDVLNNIANGETNIAVYEAELESIEQKIAAQEAIIAGLQAEIDALTAEEEA